MRVDSIQSNCSSMQIFCCSPARLYSGKQYNGRHYSQTSFNRSSDIPISARLRTRLGIANLRLGGHQHAKVLSCSTTRLLFKPHAVPLILKLEIETFPPTSRFRDQGGLRHRIISSLGRIGSTSSMLCNNIVVLPEVFQHPQSVNLFGLLVRSR